jgi:hypothetical protein
MITPAQDKLTISQANGYSPEVQKTPLKAIRAHCRWCCGRIWDEGKYVQESQPSECRNKECDLYPYRSGKNPFRARSVMSDEQRSNASERLILARMAKRKIDKERSVQEDT